MSFIDNDEAALAAAFAAVASEIDDTSRVPSVSDIWFPDLSLYETASLVDSSCVGDGVTDDSTAFQAYLDANTGKKILIPDGWKLNLTARIESHDDTPIVGEGPGSVLSWENYTGTSQMLINDGHSTTGNDGIIYDNFKVIGPGNGLPSGQNNGSPTGILSKRVENLYIGRLLVEKCVGSAILLQGVEGATLYRNHVRDTGRDAYVCWWYDYNLADVNVLFCHAERCGDDHFAFQGAQTDFANGEDITTCDMELGSGQITNIVGPSCSSGDIGKRVSVAGAGADALPLEGVITSVESSSAVTIDAVAVTGVVSAAGYYGFERMSNINIFYCNGIGAEKIRPFNNGRGLLCKGATDVLAAFCSFSKLPFGGIMNAHEDEVSAYFRSKSLRQYFIKIADAGQYAGIYPYYRYGMWVQNCDDVIAKKIYSTNAYSGNSYTATNRDTTIEIV